MNNWIDIFDKFINLIHYTTITFIKNSNNDMYHLHIKSNSKMTSDIDGKLSINISFKYDNIKEAEDIIHQIEKSFKNWYLVKHLPFLKMVNLAYCTSLRRYHNPKNSIHSDEYYVYIGFLRSDNLATIDITCSSLDEMEAVYQEIKAEFLKRNNDTDIEELRQMIIHLPLVGSVYLEAENDFGEKIRDEARVRDEI